MSSVRRFDLADLAGRQCTYLLELDLGGTVCRIASQARSAPTYPDGTVRPYAGGLKFGGTVKDPLALLADTPEKRSIPVTAQLWPEWNIAELESRGKRLSTARARLHLWAIGTDSYLTLIDGVVRTPDWNLPSDAVTLTIEEDFRRDQGRFPPITARVGDDTMPATRDTNLDGEFYPWPVGAPRLRGSEHVSTPAYNGGQLVATDYYAVISGEPVEATEVQILNKTTGISQYRAVTTITDDLGRSIGAINCSAPLPILAMNSGDELWIEWTDSSGDPAYGIKSRARPGEAMTGIGELLEFMLRRSSIRYDRGRVAVLARRFDHWIADTYVLAKPDQRVIPWSYIQDHILSILPISPTQGPHGLYFVEWNYNATSADSILHLEQGHNAHRAGRVEPDDIYSLYNEIELSYGFSPRENSYTERIILTGDEDTIAEDPDAYPNLYARRGRTIYGDHNEEPRILELKTKIVQDNATARRIAGWKIARHFAPWDRATYNVDREDAARLSPGDVVTVTDSDRSWDRRVALVEEKLWTKTGTIPIRLGMAPVFRSAGP